MDGVSNEQDLYDPFDGRGHRFYVTAEVDTVRLQEEISRACKQEVQTVLAQRDPDRAPSPEQPDVLFVYPDTVNAATVQQVLDGHQVWRAPAPGTTSLPTTIAQDEPIVSATEKLAAGQTLTPGEIATVLKALLGVTPAVPQE